MTTLFCEDVKRDEAIRDRCDARKEIGETFAEIGKSFRDMSASHVSRINNQGRAVSYSFHLSNGETTVPICDAVTARGIKWAAHKVAMEYRGTLKNLELPGWKVVCGETSWSVQSLYEKNGSK